jgi:large subunit ribosomal protein L21
MRVYAIVQTGGRQIRMQLGTSVTIDNTASEPGEEIAFDRVLLVQKESGEIVAGAPLVANARVVGVVEGEARGPKIRVFVKKRRKGMRKTRGHRSTYTRVRVKEILL